MLIKSLIVAFSMYSIIPMPHADWSERNMRWSFCFFPLVGAAVGGASFLWILACGFFDVGDIARCCILAAIPLLVTGGIHADGFADTMDAVHSWQDREKKLEIMRDSHIGAFAVIMLALYYLCFLAGLSEIDFANARMCVALGLAFVYSRALAGTALVFGKSARHEGLAYAFAKAGSLRAVRVVMLIWDGVSIAAFFGLDFRFGIVLGGIGIMLLLRFLLHTKKVFGGLTGDLCGCFIMMAELIMILLLGVLSHA
ncbi:MAG: adenosylcobinamide-GDP ribazoletransferase [Lachnospiraceae bacterium]|nr:adenosylcobinamide-GDP ribazoletransferase [Lachnospiraceae bacterium]